MVPGAAALPRGLGPGPGSGSRGALGLAPAPLRALFRARSGFASPSSPSLPGVWLVCSGKRAFGNGGGRRGSPAVSVRDLSLQSCGSGVPLLFVLLNYIYAYVYITHH